MTTSDAHRGGEPFGLSVLAGTMNPLDRLLAPVTAVDVADPVSEMGSEGPGIRCYSGSGSPQWLHADGWRVFASPARSRPSGRVLATFRTDAGIKLAVTVEGGGSVSVPFSLSEAYDNLTRERWTAAGSQRRVPEGALGAFYLVKRLIPRRTQLIARRALIRWQGQPDFPRWPFDATVAQLLSFYVRCLLTVTGAASLDFDWFWPYAHEAAVILTHDVESEAGMRNAIEIASLEEDRGLRSSFNLVGDWYPIDWGIVTELRHRGFELGVHGWFHDRSLFGDRSEFERQLPLLSEFKRRLGAEGFRSPATHRVIDWLSELPVRYDCTIPMSDPYEPQPGGCCSPWPFFLGDLVELPYTLPQDHVLFTLKREANINTWVRQLESLKGVNGLIQCVTHPDPGYLGAADNRRRYEAFLDVMHDDPGLWKALPRDVAAWWRRRGNGQTNPEERSIGEARLDPVTDTISFHRTVSSRAQNPGH